MARRLLYPRRVVAGLLLRRVSTPGTPVVIGRRGRRVLAGLLCAAVFAAACSSDPESASGPVDDSLGEVAEVKDNWPHCEQYGALQAAVVELDAADEAVFAAEEVLDGANAEYRQVAGGTDRVAIADAESAAASAFEALSVAQADRDSASDAFVLAQSEALAAVETAIRDGTLNEDVRYAAQAAADAYGAALDAAGFVARGVALPEQQSEAYRQAVEAATDAALALTDSQRALAQAQIGNAEQRVERAQTAHEAALAAVSEREDELRGAEDTVRVRRTEAGGVVAMVESELAEQVEALRAEAKTPLQEQLFRLELIVRLVAHPFQDEDWETFTAVRGNAAALYVAAGGAQNWGDNVGFVSAWPVSWDAYIAAYGALSQRLQSLADESGLSVQALAGYESLLADRANAWSDAVPLDWVQAVSGVITGVYAGYADSAIRTVLADQDVYDDLTYEQMVRYARTSAADLVLVEDSVAAAQAEEQAWSAGSRVRAFFDSAALALDDERHTAIAEGRLHNRGDPTLDNIAWRGFEGTLDALSAAAQERIRAVRAEITEFAGVDDNELRAEIDADARVVAARRAVTEAETTLNAETDRLRASREQTTATQSELASAEAELRQAHADSEASRPPYDRAVLAAWLAVGEAAGCR